MKRRGEAVEQPVASRGEPVSVTTITVALVERRRAQRRAASRAATEPRTGVPPAVRASSSWPTLGSLRLEVEEVVVQVQRARVVAQRSRGAHPAEQAGAGDRRDRLVAVAAHQRAARCAPAPTSSRSTPRAVAPRRARDASRRRRCRTARTITRDDRVARLDRLDRGCTSTDANASSSSVDITQTPPPSVSSSAVADARQRAGASARSGRRAAAPRAPPRRRRASRRARRARASAARAARSRARRARRSSRGESASSRYSCSAIARGVELGVADGQAVGDDRAAARHRLEAGHAAGRVHEHVGRREQVGHPVGEAEHAHVARRRRSAASRRSRAASLRPATQTTVVSGSAAELVDGALEVADAPAAAGDDDDVAARRAGRARRARRRARAARGTPPRSAAARPARCRARRSARRRATDCVVHHEVGVDAALRPEEEPRHVGDRRDRRHVDLAAAAQVAEHDGDRRVGRDDDVGVAPRGSRGAATPAPRRQSICFVSQRIGARCSSDQ